MAHDEVDLMALSALDMFSVGIGPSSSHTVGPMRAAGQFADGLQRDGLLTGVDRVQAELFGSLGATGHGHGSDKAVILGLQGNRPETVDTDTADQEVAPRPRPAGSSCRAGGGRLRPAARTSLCTAAGACPPTPTG